MLPAFLDDDALARVMDALEALPMKVLWGLRPTRDAGGPSDDERIAARAAAPAAATVPAWPARAR